MATAEKQANKTIITPEAIASYPNLVKPRENKSGKLKYGLALVFPRGTDLKPMKTLALATLKAKYGDKTQALIKAGKLHWPFRDAAIDVEEKGYPEGSTFVNVNTERKPGVVNTVPDKDGRPTVIEPSEVYPGAIVKASLDCYLFDTDGNKGVTFGLRNVQFIRDGDRLDGVRKAADEFEADPNAVAGLDEMEDSDANEDESGDDLGDLGL